MSVPGNRRMVSAVSLVGITIMKARGASTFKTHANPQEDLALVDII